MNCHTHFIDGEPEAQRVKKSAQYPRGAGKEPGLKPRKAEWSFHPCVLFLSSPSAGQCAKCFVLTSYLMFTVALWVSAIIIPILQIRQLRPKEVKALPGAVSPNHRHVVGQLDANGGDAEAGAPTRHG